MKSNAIVKAMVLGAIACSISAIGFAANVEAQHTKDINNIQLKLQYEIEHSVNP